ncbi:AAA ATPase central domain protein [Gloeomargarita lithophora Alchichica-D10]|uniref:AAA ATPase central domain protein n=1 Tax=Gloeomargarita lithophora Alchichica-D10 TaxID=1188229 RepID=A0A1J0A9Y2_9CYAN|nr:AAA family ATPase [Gloeomargarita lithophora]APB32746.1 AAA ATPase central domain protein [Gloeomargarita lithophora Alchichica-D10]
MDWATWNRQFLESHLRQVRQCLERAEPSPPSPLAHLHLHLTTAQYVLQTALHGAPALERLGLIFGLTPFEVAVLVLGAGMELEATWSPLCAQAQGDPQRNYPTPALALKCLPQPHWSAFTPAAPLRYWQLIHLGNGSTLSTSSLRLDEQILHYLLGLNYLDTPLMHLVQPVATAHPLAPSHQDLAQHLQKLWQTNPRQSLIICGADRATRRDLVHQACHPQGYELWQAPAAVFAAPPKEMAPLLHRWQRQAQLTPAVLLIEGDALGEKEQMLGQYVQNNPTPIILSTPDRPAWPGNTLLILEAQALTLAEQRQLWQELWGQKLPPRTIDSLVWQFQLNRSQITHISQTVMGDQTITPEALPPKLWSACRRQSRTTLSDLAQRLNTQASWDDLVLPAAQLHILKELMAQVRQRATVYETWGMGGKTGRGLGLSVLFAGPSGTGKTLAADVLAHELGLDLYRIDLSAVVSKYIGETEKNLRRVFDAAEMSGAVLLFDEADALFGKRSEVKDSHDRYANIEVGYLLQRMEAYRGLAILTTNLKDALDAAFLRRIRYIVRFPFPDASQRAEIWRRSFPAQTPTQGLDYLKLAQLGVAGGNIRNIALNAAFLAADHGEPLQMRHLLLAARSEYIKLEKPLTDAEVRGWV